MVSILEYLFLTIIGIEISYTLQLSDEFVEKNDNFTLDFYSNLISISEYNNKSIVISPISIQTAGALLYAGANGITAKQMFNGFQLLSNDSVTVGKTYEPISSKYVNSPVMKTLNKIYIMNGNIINPNFTEIAVKSFKSEVENINFGKTNEAVENINKWVENKTEGIIKDFIEPNGISDTMKMLLINVIHFKGEWETKFEKENTRKVNFWITKDKSIQVDMMYQIGNYKFANLPELSAFAVEIPFKENLSFFALLPRNSNLDNLQKKIQKVNLKKIFNEVRTFSMAISLPKFKIETSVDMPVILKYMGMWDMFGINADFSKLFLTGEPLEVSKAIHKAVINVDENGAEAAAATGFGISFRTGPFHLNFNQPFLYFVKGEKSEIYFMGRYMGE